jgi:hypothetical protein
MIGVPLGKIEILRNFLKDKEMPHKEQLGIQIARWRIPRLDYVSSGGE